MSQSSSSADRNLLFGILALQMDFISRDALIAAMHAWVLDKAKSLGQLLVEHGVLSLERRSLLETLVQEHLKQHGNDAQQSLAAVLTPRSVRQHLDQLADADVQASLAQVVAGDVAQDTNMTTISTPPGSGSGLRYHILRPHARGGLGEVFVALDAELNREIALKEIQPRHADQPESRTRFLLEAEITGRLEHPGIVPVYGLGHYPDGRPYYAMRFIKGDSLKEAIAQFHQAKRQGGSAAGEHTLQLRQLLDRFLDVCNALAYAHSRGVLHRDLKPGNIMLGEFGETLVVDWGLAKPLDRSAAPDASEGLLQPATSGDSALTQMGRVMGTPAYMSPEQAAGRLDQLGPATDVYSLGATLYCLLTGQEPIRGADGGEVLRKVQKGDFPPPRQVKRSIPPALEAICLKAMSLKPEDRYNSPRNLAQDIEHWLADEAVTVFQEPVRARLGRWGRRHKTLVTGGAVLLVTAVVALAAGVILLGRKQVEVVQERDAAQKARDQAEAISKFYENHVLAAARPKGWAGGVGKDVTLKEALDQAAPQIDQAFADQPELEATVCNTLGMTYWYLGRFEAANPQLEKAYAIRLDRLGPEHPDTLTSLQNLAMQRWKQAKFDEAVAMGRQALERRRRVLGPEHQDTLWSQLNLGLFLSIQDQLDEAESLLSTAVESCKRMLGPHHHHTLYGQHDLAVLLGKKGKLQEAVALNRETLEGRRRALGPDHPDTLRSMDNLGSSLLRVGELKEAEALCRASLEGRRRVLGDGHTETSWSLSSLTDILEAEGKLEEAEALCRQYLEAKRRLFGPEHDQTFNAEHRLALFLWSHEKKTEAEALFRQILDARRRVLGRNHPDTMLSLVWVGHILMKRGQLDEAEELYRQLLAEQRKSLASHSPVLANTLISLGSVLNTKGRPMESEPLLREGLAIREKNLSSGHWLTASARGHLGDSLARQGKFAEAEEFFRAAYEGLTTATERRNELVTQVLDRFIKLYDMWGKPEQAEAWRKKRPPSGK